MLNCVLLQKEQATAKAFVTIVSEAEGEYQVSPASLTGTRFPVMIFSVSERDRQCH